MDYKLLLIELLSSLKISKKKFAEQLGLSQGNVSDWFNRPGYRPSIDALKRISEVYNVNLNWLITGTGAMYIEERARVSKHAPPTFITLPVVADIAAGIGIEAEDVEPREHISLPTLMLSEPGPYYCFRVMGVSMEPELHTGDYAVIAAFKYDQDYDGAICAFRGVDGLLLKRLVLDHRKKRSLLIPLNPSHPIMIYDESSSDLVLLGRLITVIRKYI